MPTVGDLLTGVMALEDAQTTESEKPVEDDPVRIMLDALRASKMPTSANTWAVVKVLAPNQLRILAAVLLKSSFPIARPSIADTLNMAYSLPPVED